MKRNPTNPFDTDEDAIKRRVPSPIRKAKVVSVNDHPDEDGFHTVRIRVYGEPDKQSFTAPVVVQHKGDVSIPERGDDVVVAFSEGEKPWIIGYWYPVDRVRDSSDTVNLPEYDEGDRIIGNSTGSYLGIRDNGTIEIITDGTAPINLDRQEAISHLSFSQSIPNDDTYYKVEFDTEKDNDENIFDPSTHDMTILHDGLYEVSAGVEVPLPGQNNRYSLAVFVNGTEEKRRSRQSSTNEELSLSVSLTDNLNEGDMVDIRLKQNSGSSIDLNGSSITSSFVLKRSGV